MLSAGGSAAVSYTTYRVAFLPPKPDPYSESTSTCLIRPGFGGGSGVSRVSWRRWGGFLGHGDRCLHFELYRRHHAERGVSALAVVPDLDVVEHRIGELDPGGPALAVEELDLHP